MNRSVVVGCLFLLLGMHVASAGEVATAKPVEMHIQADSAIDYDLDGKVFVAQPNVRVTYGDMVLTADKVEGNPATGELRATGHVVFTSQAHQMKSESLVFNTNTQTGKALNSTSVENGIYFTGKEMTVQEKTFKLLESRFTSCSLDHPHYYLSAKEVSVVPGSELLAKNVSIVLFGRKIASLPKYKVNLAESQQQNTQTLPPITFGKKYGLMMGREVDLSKGTATMGTFSAGLSTRQLFHTGLFYDRLDGKPIFLRGSYRMPVYEGTRSGTLVTRIPEVGMRFSIGAQAKRHPTTTDLFTK